jgi:uncharacterized membrane protein YoaT (DUF817 family)
MLFIRNLKKSLNIDGLVYGFVTHKCIIDIRLEIAITMLMLFERVLTIVLILAATNRLNSLWNHKPLQ